MLSSFCLESLGIAGERDTSSIASIQLSAHSAVADAVGRWCAAHEAVPDCLTVAGAKELDSFRSDHAAWSC